MSAPPYAPVPAAAPADGGGAPPPPGPPPVAPLPPPPAPRAQAATQRAPAPASAEEWAAAMDRGVQRTLDALAPHQLYRWVGLAALVALFFLRMFLIHGFYIVTYVLLIFILNQFILFLQPKDRASLLARRASDGEGGAGEGASAASDPAALPTRDAEEFRPFVRRLPEFQMWHSVTVATALSIAATFFPVFDVPVYWPVLVFYFVMLFVATMRRQWLDMKRLKYVPWDIGAKKTYKSDPKRVSVKPRDAATLARAQVDAAPAVGAAVVGGPLAAPPPPPPVPTVKRAPAAKQSVS